MALSDIASVPQFSPLEDLILALLRPLEDEIPGLKVRTMYEENVTTPFILVRRISGAYASSQFGKGEERFVQRAVLAVQVITEDPNGDEKGAVLSELIRRVLTTAWLHQVVVPGAGSIATLVTLNPPHRASDWMTGTEVLQYANLPQQMHRYETEYGLILRPPHDPPDPLELFV